MAKETIAQTYARAQVVSNSLPAVNKSSSGGVPQSVPVYLAPTNQNADLTINGLGVRSGFLRPGEIASIPPGGTIRGYIMDDGNLF